MLEQSNIEKELAIINWICNYGLNGNLLKESENPMTVNEYHTKRNHIWNLLVQKNVVIDDDNVSFDILDNLLGQTLNVDWVG